MLAADLPPSPVIAGDYADPSVLRTADGYWGVATSGGWAPVFRLFRSADLRTWTLRGAVFYRRPGWARTSFWAPELARLGGGYAVLYSALPRRRRNRSWYCLGIAFAPTPAGPWRDLGRPLRCSRLGSIDPELTRDERGRLTVLFKEDGNQFKRPTTIFAQRIAENGRRMVGRPRALLRNRARWEGKVIEAPEVVRRPDGFYLFYSGGACCTEKCDYAIGVARAPSLLGPWRRYPGNPILRGGNGWRCPGHATLVDDAILYHAYLRGGGQAVGRQVILDGLAWGPSGWPRIGAGRTPALAPADGSFSDDLTARRPEWEYPVERAPRVSAGPAGLRLTAARRGARRLDGGVLSRRIGDSSFTATVSVYRTSLRGPAQAGLAAYRSGYEAIGVSVGRGGGLTVWQRRGGRFGVLARGRAPAGDAVTLRLVARGRSVRFAAATGAGAGVGAFRSVGGPLRSPIVESERLALTVGGATGAAARFTGLRFAALARGG